MRPHQVGIVAGLAFGSFINMLVILFACACVSGLSAFLVPLATFGVFLGVFAATLVVMTIYTAENVSTDGVLVTELA